MDERRIWYYVIQLTILGVSGFLLAGILDHNFTLAPMLLAFSILLVLTAGWSWCGVIGEFVVSVLNT
jgi:hypothetical protein